MDLLAGFAGDDRLSGSGGDDLLIGDTGDPAFGAVVRVQDFNPDEDRLEVPTTWQGDVEITLSEVDQGVMVPVGGTDTIHLPGLRADQVNVAAIVLSRI